MALRTLGDLAQMAADLPGELQRAQLRGVQKSALHVTRAIRDETRIATGGDNRLSGVGRRGARVGVRFDVRGTVSPVALISAWGPYHFLEHDMPPHTITPRGRRVSKRWANLAAKGKVPKGNKFLSGAKALKLPDGRFAARVVHPGSTGSRPFERGYLRSRGESGPIFDAEVQAAIRRALS